MHKYTIERLVKLALLASPDPTRYYLNGVWISCLEEGKLLAQVTDGHRAIQEIIEWPSEYITFEGNFFLSRDDLKTIKTLAKSSIASLAYNKDRDQLIFSGSLSIKRSDSKPPEFSAFYKTHKSTDEGVKTIGFNARYLFEIMKALQDRPKCEGVKIMFKDPLSPITIICDGKEAVLMPLRV